MYISFVLPDLRGGGAQKMIINLANEFAARGERVDLVIFEPDSSYNNLLNQNVRLISFEKKRAIFALPSLTSYIRKNQPDIIISALFHVNLITILAKLLALKSKTKLVISERNHLSLRLKELPFFKEFFIKIFVQLLYPVSDVIIGISNGVCDDLKNILRNKSHNKIKTIYNPVVTQEFASKIKERVPNPFEGKEGLKLITSGRLVAQKDYPTLLKSLADYNEKYGPAHLVILGDGPLKSQMVNLSKDLKINDNISFLGFVDNPLAYMKTADIFVISSAWEGFCNVIVEALYAGLKIVATDCPSGPAEILLDDQYGLLAPVGDSMTLSNNINIISQKYVDPLAQNSRALDFTVEKKADEFMVVFEEVIS